MIRRLLLFGIAVILLSIPFTLYAEPTVSYQIDPLNRDLTIRNVAKEMCEEILEKVYPDVEGEYFGVHSQVMYNGYYTYSYHINVPSDEPKDRIRLVLTVLARFEEKEVKEHNQLLMEMHEVKFTNALRAFDPPDGDEAFSDLTKMGRGHWRNEEGSLYQEIRR